MFDTRSYLQRISHSSETVPTEDNLRRVHLAHMRSVPFENLDIHLGRRIELNLNAFFRKIVHKNRGGFCYELNGLFAHLLKSLGYSVTMLSARVARSDGSFGPDFDHMTLMVELDARWIADVGFGDSFVEPLLLDKGDEQFQYGRGYRIIPNGDDFLYQSLVDGRWNNQYRFQLIPRQLQEYLGMCSYHQTSPDSTFTQKVVCSRATEDGRITLTDKKLVLTSGISRTEISLSGKEHFQALLQKHFGIVLKKELQIQDRRFITGGDASSP
jgi:N-hydroxyarylamine O-acetyltransferase